MAGYQDLSKFERGVIVGARDMGYSIFEKHAAWSVESRFQLNRADGRVQVWRQPHESMNPIFQQGTIQDSVMVWGVCSGHGMGPLIRQDTTLTSNSYDALQRAFQKRSPPSVTPIHLWTALQDPWYQLPPALLQTLIE
ncbi:uncharacterized protein TNCV_4700581 [Trichonephila clavipes]|nr:uncharacterized protein TNCV_4700581 [Trichonephila clavipes]